LFGIIFRCGNAEAQAQVLEWLSSLSADPAVMVRRAVGEALHELIPLVDKDTLSSVIHPIFVRLNDDDQDSVRLLAARLCTDIANVLDVGEAAEAVLPHMQRGSADLSWRVRYVFAERFADLQAAFGQPLAKEMLPAFVRLLDDSEPEVRGAAALQVCAQHFARCLIRLVGESHRRPGSRSRA